MSKKRNSKSQKEDAPNPRGRIQFHLTRGIAQLDPQRSYTSDEARQLLITSSPELYKGKEDIMDKVLRKFRIPRNGASKGVNLNRMLLEMAGVNGENVPVMLNDFWEICEIAREEDVLIDYVTHFVESPRGRKLGVRRDKIFDGPYIRAGDLDNFTSAIKTSYAAVRDITVYVK